MRRRDFLKTMGFGVASLHVPGCLKVTQQKFNRAYENKPNIILIMADDIGYECFGCYGGTSYQTPVLDKLAETGMRFTHCYSQPLCSPSRVKLMTGQSNIRNYSNFSILNKEENTFGPMLQNCGYKTAVTGKWQLYGARHYKELAGTGTHPSQAGFDEYCLWQVDRLGSRYWNPLIEINGKIMSGTKEKYGPDVFCDFITRFMKKHKDEHFFIYYPMVLTHDPFVPTPDSTNPKSKDVAKNFADMVAYLDKIVGRILDELEQLGLRNNTLLLFTSDNGTHKKIKSRRGEKTVKGGKGLMTDAGTRVPLIVNWPGTVPGGEVCEDLVDFSDFLPTLAKVSNSSLPKGVVLDGRSFLPQLLGRAGNPREWIFCYYNPRPDNKKFPELRFARDQRWKLYGNGNLYDIKNDVLEENPIFSDTRVMEAEKARKKLQAALDSMPKKPKKIF